MMSDWISVKDRLPEFTTRCGSEAFVFVIAVGESMGVGEYEYSSKRGFTKVGFELNVNYKVTHWMPLPEPPEVDDE